MSGRMNKWLERVLTIDDKMDGKMNGGIEIWMEIKMWTRFESIRQFRRFLKGGVVFVYS